MKLSIPQRRLLLTLVDTYVDAMAEADNTDEYLLATATRKTLQTSLRSSRKPAVPLKTWIGNLDGSRLGLVIATSKERACSTAGVGRRDFDEYWKEETSGFLTLEPDVLYTRKIDDRGPWHRGRCPL